jgi:hypothetical protein
LNKKISSVKLGSGSFFGIHGGSFLVKYIQAADFLTSVKMGRRQFFRLDEAAELTFTVNSINRINSKNNNNIDIDNATASLTLTTL